MTHVRGDDDMSDTSEGREGGRAHLVRTEADAGVELVNVLAGLGLISCRVGAGGVTGAALPDHVLEDGFVL